MARSTADSDPLSSAAATSSALRVCSGRLAMRRA
jgi:hypothetical protein